MTTIQSITYKFIQKYNYKMLEIRFKKISKMQALLVISNGIAHTVRLNKVHC